MSDLISRQAAIDALKDMYNAAEKWGKEASDDVIKARAESCMASLVEMKLRIEKLPSAQPEPLTDEELNEAHNEGYDVGYWAGRRDYEPKWIPVTERFPELDQEVLVYAIGKDDGFIGDSVITISERFIFRLFPWSDGVEEWRSPWEYFDSNYEITHWMPLPEPPKKI